MPQRTEIIWETEETIVVKRGATVMGVFCPKCGSDVEMVSPEALVSLAATDEREIFRLIEAGKVHFIGRERTLACISCYQRTTNAADESRSKMVCEGNAAGREE